MSFVSGQEDSHKTFRLKPQKPIVLGTQGKTALSETHQTYFPHDFYVALMRQGAPQTKNVCRFNNTNIGRITAAWLCCFVVLFPKISVGIISKILLYDNDYRANQKAIEKVQENSVQFFLHL